MENFKETEQIGPEETLLPQPSPKKKYLLIGIITALVVLSGGAGVLVLLMQKEGHSGELKIQGIVTNIDTTQMGHGKMKMKKECSLYRKTKKR